MDPSHQIDFPPINDVHLLDVIKVCDDIFFLKSVKPNLRRNLYVSLPDRSFYYFQVTE